MYAYIEVVSEAPSSCVMVILDTYFFVPVRSSSMSILNIRIGARQATTISYKIGPITLKCA